MSKGRARLGWPLSWMAVAVVAGIQTAVLVYMVADRVALLSYGREIVLDVVPVDPRSLFQGDYVILGYPAASLPAPIVPAGLKRGQVVYVTLEKDAAGAWSPIAASADFVEPANDAQIVLKGPVEQNTAAPGAAPFQVRVTYGIENYFVPEGEGLALEKLVRDRKISAQVAVDGSGDAALKGLIAGQDVIWQEPLF